MRLGSEGGDPLASWSRAYIRMIRTALPEGRGGEKEEVNGEHGEAGNRCDMRDKAWPLL